MKRSQPLAHARPARRLARIVAASAALPLAGCGHGVLDPQGPVAAANRAILLNSLAIMLAIVVPTILATFAFAWWFRSGNRRAAYRPDFVYSGQIELVVWAIPAMVVLLLGGITWVGSHQLDPWKPLPSKVKPVEVEVVALDWKWLFIYPDRGVASVNRLVVPAGVPVHFRLTATSVMNSFFVPQLGSQIYAMPGMTSQLHLQADRPGRYPGLAAHYNGQGFADMHFTVEAMPADRFADWVGNARGRPPLLDAGNYARLATRSENVAPMTFGGVAPGLFDAIVRMQAPPPAKPGQDDGRAKG